MKKIKKSRVSKIKHDNKKRTKLVKQGKLKQKCRKKTNVENTKPVKPTNFEVNGHAQEEEEESDHGEGMLDMMESDDLAFLQQAVANKSYSIFNQIHNKVRNSHDAKSKVNSRGDAYLAEETFEDSVTARMSGRTKLMLPIKTKQGLIRREIEADEMNQETNVCSSDMQPKSKGDDAIERSDELVQEASLNGINLSEPISTANVLALRHKMLQEQKFLIGVLASGLLENPEEKMKNFKRLLDMLDKPTSEVATTVQKYCALSLLEVFKDLLPSYQIKHAVSEGVKLKKATLALQTFEKLLLQSYKSYLQKLEKIASVLFKKRGDNRVQSVQDIKLGITAVQCMCELLVMHPYFNFSTNVAQLVVIFLDNPRVDVRQMCANNLEKVFKEDKRSEISLHIVRRINHLVKAKKHSVHCELLKVLLALRIKDVNLDREKETDVKKKKLMNHKQKLLHLSKNERKRSKKLEQVEKEMTETKAEESKQSKQKNLTEITKVVFTIYFRILKREPSSKLLSVALEGLAKFSHCINLDFYHDLVNVMDKLMDNESLGLREQLHCIQTVFTILSGQGDVLTIDPLRFYVHLYRNLLHINAGKNHSNLCIILRTLDVVLIRRGKKVSQQRLVAFAKRLGLLSTQVLHNGSLSCLAIIKSVMQLNRTVDVLLDSDSSLGQGTYFPEVDEPEYCNASNTALWELTTLQRHYHPVVRKFATNVLHSSPASGEGAVLPEHSKLSAEQFFSEFDPSEGKFVPNVPVWKKTHANTKPFGAVLHHHIMVQGSCDEDVPKEDVLVDFYSQF